MMIYVSRSALTCHAAFAQTNSAHLSLVIVLVFVMVFSLTQLFSRVCNQEKERSAMLVYIWSFSDNGLNFMCMNLRFFVCLLQVLI